MCLTHRGSTYWKGTQYPREKRTLNTQCQDRQTFRGDFSNLAKRSNHLKRGMKSRYLHSKIQCEQVKEPYLQNSQGEKVWPENFIPSRLSIKSTRVGTTVPMSLSGEIYRIPFCQPRGDWKIHGRKTGGERWVYTMVGLRLNRITVTTQCSCWCLTMQKSYG